MDDDAGAIYHLAESRAQELYEAGNRFFDDSNKWRYRCDSPVLYGQPQLIKHGSQGIFRSFLRIARYTMLPLLMLQDIIHLWYLSEKALHSLFRVSHKPAAINSTIHKRLHTTRAARGSALIFFSVRFNIEWFCTVQSSMFVEEFITYVARKKNFRYLQFAPTPSLSAPPIADNMPRMLYMHVPFCQELCPYCSFHRVVFEEGLARAYFEALRKEILMYSRLGYVFSAIYVGGGTPTVLMDELVQTLTLAREAFPIREISVETNPDHLNSHNIEALKAIGVNRLSVGVQSFDDQLLTATQRYHKYGSGQDIVERLRFTQGHFDTLNVDMIFNFPLQTMATLERDLSILLDLGADQITYYPLMPSSYAAEAMRKRLGGSVDFRREKGFYNLIADTLASQYTPSTAWCFSRTEALIDEYVVNFDEYAGLGSGSIGYLNGTVYANTFDIGDYIARVNKETFPLAGRKESSLTEQLRYHFLMKLFGLKLDLDQFAARFGVNAYRYLLPEIFFFRVIGGLEKKGHLLTLTHNGQYYWVIMMREFFIGVNNLRDFCRSATYESS